MKYRGKIIGGLIGALVFMGLHWAIALGALVGAAVGHFAVDSRILSPTDRAYEALKKREWIFISFVFTLCAKVAKAKGAINSYEIKFMERLITNQFKLKDDGRTHAISIWNEAKSSAKTFEEYALEFYHEFGNERHHVVNMMDVMIGIAACDQTLHPKEEALLFKACGIFRISRLQYDRIKSRHIAPPKQEKWTPLDPHYAVLGASPQDDLNTIKQKYRTLVKKWHPDTLAAQNASKDALRHANKRFQEIKEAYDVILQRTA